MKSSQTVSLQGEEFIMVGHNEVIMWGFQVAEAISLCVLVGTI